MAKPKLYRVTHTVTGYIVAESQTDAEEAQFDVLNNSANVDMTTVVQVSPVVAEIDPDWRCTLPYVTRKARQVFQNTERRSATQELVLERMIAENRLGE